ncbi:MAG: OmpA family protein [Pseudomonadota bacterium]|nr:OmpA family protein [Pseudomonadota bacterium]
MLKLDSRWYFILGASILLTACQQTEEKNVQDQASLNPGSSVVTALAEAKTFKQKEAQSLRLTSQIAQKKSAKNKALEATLPTLDDRYTMLFDINSNGLNDAYKGELVAFAEYLNKNAAKKIHIDGFTCELGSAEYNVALGQRRAYAVSKFLESKGVSNKQIILVSYGKERPADPQHNEIAWMKNRRVEVYF